MNNCTERLYNGIIKENPTFVLMLGMCPTLAVTTSAINGLGMGLSTTAVLVLSNLMISLLRKVIPDSLRIPAFIVVVASFVTMVQFLMEGFIPDIQGLMRRLKEHNIYTIARVVAFRDPYLPEQKPELALKLADGSIYRDNKGLAWVNPYKREAWDYLVEVGIGAHQAGFDEVQFDYIRFSTERGINNVVYDEADTGGRSKTQIIAEFMEYAYEKLEQEGVYVSADVFGAIIGGGVDSENVGQAYEEMARHLDYICPMIYPSHYGDGNFGIEHPDMQPYDTILAALQGSRRVLDSNSLAGHAVVRPWLQDFTASYLEHYIQYGDQQVQEQIQAVYDAGYDEWLLWSAACKYHWGALRSWEEAGKEAPGIAAGAKAGQQIKETKAEDEGISLKDAEISFKKPAA